MVGRVSAYSLRRWGIVAERLKRIELIFGVRVTGDDGYFLLVVGPDIAECSESDDYTGDRTLDFENHRLSMSHQSPSAIRCGSC